MATQIDTQDLNFRGRRIAARRIRDPYFDAVCETLADLDRRIMECEDCSVYPTLLAARLKAQRGSCLDTIRFMLDDHVEEPRRAA